MAVYEAVFFILLGLVMGSFGNVLIARLPKGESIVRPGSHCPKCQTPIKPWHNIPVLSWLLLRGRCAACGEAISIRYPLVELASGVIFAAIWWKSGASLFSIMAAMSFFLLFILSIIDLEYTAVPDHVNLPALLFALASTPYFFLNFENALLLAGGMALLRFFVSWIFQKEAMGEGDVIVAATMGALLGVQGALVAIFVGSVISLPVALYARFKGRDPEIPFIPYLAAGALIVYLSTPWLVNLWSA